MAYKNIYQFKITLQDISPAIWRRIQVPENYTFWDLHVAIQDSMGWTDSHLHAFRIKNPDTGEIEEIGIPDDEGYEDMMTWLGGKYDPDEFDCKKVKFDNPGKRLDYKFAEYKGKIFKKIISREKVYDR